MVYCHQHLMLTQHHLSFLVNFGGGNNRSPALKNFPLLTILPDALICGSHRNNNKTMHADEEALVVRFRELFCNRRFQANNYRNTSCIDQASRTKQGYCGHGGRWGHWVQECSKNHQHHPHQSTKPTKIAMKNAH